MSETLREKAERLGLNVPEPPRVLRELPPETYVRLFEGSPEGAAVLAELSARFYVAVAPDGGLDAVVKMVHANGQRSVIEFIVGRISEAHDKRET